MDLSWITPILPLLTGILATAAALGGVLITTRANRRGEDKRLALEERKEATRLAREDEAENRASEMSRVERQTAVYNEIAQMFVGELSNLRAQRNSRELSFDDFKVWWDPEWSAQGEMRFRRSIAHVTRDDHRVRLTAVLDAIKWHSDAFQATLTENGEYVDGLLVLGFDFASTYARGGEPSQELERRWNGFESQQATLQLFRDVRRQAFLDSLTKASGDPSIVDVAAKSED